MISSPAKRARYAKKGTGFKKQTASRSGVFRMARPVRVPFPNYLPPLLRNTIAYDVPLAVNAYNPAGGSLGGFPLSTFFIGGIPVDTLCSLYGEFFVVSCTYVISMMTDSSRVVSGLIASPSSGSLTYPAGTFSQLTSNPNFKSQGFRGGAGGDKLYFRYDSRSFWGGDTFDNNKLTVPAATRTPVELVKLFLVCDTAPTQIFAKIRYEVIWRDPNMMLS